MRLIYNNVTRTTHSPPGVDIRIPGWGNSSTVEYIDPSLSSYGAYFKSVGDTLVGVGLERGISIRGAPYDFRKAPSKKCKFQITHLYLFYYTIVNFYFHRRKPRIFC